MKSRIQNLKSQTAFTLVELLDIRHGSWRAMSKGKRKAFTLVELLVVVAIIVVLLAILLPAMESAVTAALNAKCLVNQRTTVMACRTYANDNNQVFPPFRMAGVSGDASGYDLRTYNVSPRSPIGLGLLPKSNYLPPTQLGKIVHCPRLNTMGIPAGDRGHNMDVLVSNYGAGGSYWTDPAQVGRRIIAGYQYRAPSFYRAGEKNANGTRSQGGDVRATFAGAKFVVSVDILDYRVGVRYHHLDGYNRAFGDGSAGFFPDPKLEAEALMQGKITNGVTAPDFDEEVYDFLARGR